MSSSTFRLRADSVVFDFNAVLAVVDVFGLDLGVGMVSLDTSSLDSFAVADLGCSDFLVFDGTVIFFLVGIFLICLGGDWALSLLEAAD